ncbi:tRNA lysidine(34) synthetase TilS [Actinopolymorpha alba]|uniref:tRNA lysidine(34) synthetase TilS n=1 Tax=Actinopolymorpha alba TaxID=533267 RepID=UPI00037BB2C7|nr:tRNA lysidine(34) synthetase TilS [Actinopolymorpha alba]
MGPHPAVAAVRAAVRRSLADLQPGARILVACSGGADSLALAAATAFEARRAGWIAGAITVDHGLQPGSAGRAAQVAELLRSLGLHPVEVATVTVNAGGGPEAAARRARYAALDAAADRLDARVVLLGHTRDDQAETVLLGLARGSGARSLAGMPARAPAASPDAGRAGQPVPDRYRRPLLGLDRIVTRDACAAAGLEVWEDPHNADPAYARVRVRRQVLPVMEQELGPGIAAALARTAELLRDDADALDAWADQAYADCTAAADTLAGTHAGPRADPLQVDRLIPLPAAVRRRVFRRAALGAGCPGTDLFARHLLALDALVTDWRGQVGVDLPGGIRACRRGGLISFARPPAAETGTPQRS